MEIRILIEGDDSSKEHVVYSEKPISFVEAMDIAGLNFYRPCGGTVRCLRCGIRFIFGAPDITEDDDRALDYSEIRNGWRLGCKCVIKDDCRIEVPLHLVGEIEGESLKTDVDTKKTVDEDNALAVAVDIGTTTIAVAVVDSENKIIGSTSVANSQIKYGADVMTRIDATLRDESASAEIKGMVRNDVERALGHIMNRLTNIRRVVISANTTMMHFAMGYPVGGLASYPFSPYSIEMIKYDDGRADVSALPGAGAFVGADIVSGIYALDIIKNPNKVLFVDLGTNAEIVLWDGQKLLCASAAAGPALEGGNISCGTASIKGAIDHVHIERAIKRAFVTTIGGAKPIGVCGSGVIDAVYELYRTGLIDEGGLLKEEYAESGYELAPGIRITGEDIQQVLLAKSAICSGIKVLLNEAGVDADEIDKLYVAGGLGASIKAESAIGIGIFPSELSDKFEAVGNTSLKGGVKYIEHGCSEELEAIVNRTEIVELANKKEFEELFLANVFIK